MPLLSIIIPVFNHPKELAIMLDSILASTFQNWELLAIDDGSEQETYTLLEQYVKRDERIHFIKRNKYPKGAQTCRNMGIERAQGKYLIFFDSDDHITPYCLQQRIEGIKERPDLDFMVFPSGSYTETEHFTKTGPYLFGYPIYKNDLKAFIHRTLPFTVWTNIYRTEILKQKKLSWDTNLLSFQDSDYNIQSLLHGLHYDYAIAMPDYGYRTSNNTDSISKKIVSAAHKQSHIYFLNKQYNEIQRVYGKKYNKALYLCALYIYTFVMSKGIDISFANQIAVIVSNHDKIRGILLKTKIRISQLLSIILPPKLARQLPMPIFLLRKWWIEHNILKRIKKTKTWNIDKNSNKYETTFNHNCNI